jgi:hypothetical protein
MRACLPLVLLLPILPASLYAQDASRQGAASSTNQPAAPASAAYTPLADVGRPHTTQVDGRLTHPAGPPASSDSKLLQLRSTPLYSKYVNYEAVKLMLGGSWGASNPKLHPWKLASLSATNTTEKISQESRMSARVQVLFPFPVFRYYFPVALGITYGRSRITVQDARFALENDAQKSHLVQQPDVRACVVRTDGLGIVALRVIRLPRHLRSFTVLTGLSGEYNFSTRMRIERKDGMDSVLHAKAMRPYIHRWSLPAHVQLSWSRSQFWSFGAYGSYDLVPRFKGDALHNIHQLALGASIGLVI